MSQCASDCPSSPPSSLVGAHRATMDFLAPALGICRILAGPTATGAHPTIRVGSVKPVRALLRSVIATSGPLRRGRRYVAHAIEISLTAHRVFTFGAHPPGRVIFVTFVLLIGPRVSQGLRRVPIRRRRGTIEVFRCPISFSG